MVTVPCGCGDGTHEAFLLVSSFERRQCGRLVEEGKTEGEGGGVGPISQGFFNSECCSEFDAGYFSVWVNLQTGRDFKKLKLFVIKAQQSGLFI